jgi:hypothetical protein
VRGLVCDLERSLAPRPPWWRPIARWRGRRARDRVDRVRAAPRQLEWCQGDADAPQCDQSMAPVDGYVPFHELDRGLRASSAERLASQQEAAEERYAAMCAKVAHENAVIVVHSHCDTSIPLYESEEVGNGGDGATGNRPLDHRRRPPEEG